MSPQATSLITQLRKDDALHLIKQIKKRFQIEAWAEEDGHSWEVFLPLTATTRDVYRITYYATGYSDCAQP